MNQPLKFLLNLIEQSSSLNADEKKAGQFAAKAVEAELEARIREAQVEASLERIRSRTMAMHQSQELQEVIQVVFGQLQHLQFVMDAAYVNIFQEGNKDFNIWMATSDNLYPQQLHVPYIDHPIFNHVWESRDRGQEIHTDTLTFDEKNSYFDYFFGLPLGKYIPEERKQYVKSRKSFCRTVILSKYTALSIHNYEGHGYSNEENLILKRMGTVFEQAFIRFLDIQKAENQAREAQIEASLERVRAKAMAMHNSGDLTEAAGTVFTELNKLGIHPIRSGFVLLTKDSRRAKLYPATSFDMKNTVSFTGEFEFVGHTIFEKQYESWQKQENYFPVIEGELLKSYYKILSEALSVSFAHYSNDKKQFGSFLPFSKGFLFAWSDTPYFEKEISILERFKTILDLTIRRYTDLQTAEAQAREAQLERKRSEDLLLNILPAEIAAELKQFGKSYARKHDEVTILFADIKGFSEIAENLSADELVTQLDECFRAFDKIVEKHGLEKIKTVGDAYVCACGLPRPVADHAIKTIKAAVDMLAFINGFAMTKKIQDLPAFEFRLGIHTGPVVTGVVGLKKFTYDIWGDAVNIAARMEQHGESGRINISNTTYQLVKDHIKCEHRGKLEVKGKGMIDMYFVNSSASEG